MVLTRAGVNQLRTEDLVVGSNSNMDNSIPITTSVATTVFTASTYTLASSVAALANEPSAQNSLVQAHINSGVLQSGQTSHGTSTSPSPVFSAITPGGVRGQQTGVIAAAVQLQPPVNLLSELTGLIREEMARQAEILKATLQQEVVQNVQRALSQQGSFNAQNLSSTAPELPPDVAAALSPVSIHNGPNDQARSNPHDLSQARPGNRNILEQNFQQETHPNLPSANTHFASRFSNLPGSPLQNVFPQANHAQYGAYDHFTNPRIFPNQPNRPQHFPFSSQVNPDLSKWGLKFSGTSRSISAEEFISRVGFLCQDYNISMTDIRRSFPSLLEGQALDWYYTWRKLNPDHTFDDLVAAFLAQYRRFENEFQLQKKIMDYRQGAQEPFEDFFNAVLKLRNQQRSPYAERDLIEIMRGNLKPSIANLLFSARFEGLNDFFQQAKRAENLISSQRMHYQHRPHAPPRVNEIFHEPEDLPDLDVEAVSANVSYNCWNCLQPGHSYVDCPSPNRRIFCYKCGRSNVITPQCPNCRGNRRTNQPQTGGARSTQTQTQ